MADRSQPEPLPHRDGQPAFCVCVPARNEAARLPALLDSLAAQDWPGVIPIMIAVNNTTDDSLDRIAAAQSLYGDRLDIHVAVADFPAGLAHAGSARRLAMGEGLRLLADIGAGVLVSTDADARPPVGWLRAIGAAWARGADLVGGKIVIDEEREPLPEAVVRMRDAWDRYWAAVREVEDRIDPIAWDPAPRHGDHTGASLAIRAELYTACGGVPLVPTGEDLALVRAAVAMGGRLVHPADVTVRVSPRTTGRAEGGMAEAMRLLFRSAENAAPAMAPALRHWATRAAWRRRMRERPGGHARIVQQEPLLPAMPNDMLLEAGR
jgi:cellulose synthase/poly-beta-1,6-N-acetylglucosamine synthase-like glycosyltransferase